MTELWVAGGLAIGFILGRRFGSGRESVPAASPESPSRAAIRLLDTLEDGIVAVKADGILTLVNTAGQAMLGVSRDVTGRALVDLSLGNELVLARTGPVDSDDLSEMTLDDGRIVAIRVQIRDDGSKIYVLRDVTDIRRMDAMRRDFVANVSHELRTPVSVVRANAETLLEGALEDEAVARDFVSAIHRNAERLSNLVSDLLDLARIEAGTLSTERIPIDIERCTEQTISSVRTLAESKKIALHNQVPAATQCIGDPGSLEQILTNFIENAVKYGAEDGNVWVRAYLVTGQVRIEVIDDGAGVPSQHRSRLFERFYRVDTGRSRAVGGTGLGLAIVKHLANGMGGQVGMEPNHPHGSVFWVSVPAVAEDKG